MIEQEIFHGRVILYVENFDPETEKHFQAYERASERLRKLGYTSGSMEGPNPIGFIPKPYPFTSRMVNHVPKWSKIFSDLKRGLHGAMISDDWRTGRVQVLWWEYPIVSPLDEIPWECLTESEKV
jgi:hypothetical protein